jgi:hypothetical protein
MLRATDNIWAYAHILRTKVKNVKLPRKKPTLPSGVRQVKAPGYLDNRHTMVVRLSALRTGRLYTLEYPDNHFESVSRPRAHGLLRIGSNNKQSVYDRYN